jgi:ParB family chromosome partitioning protein
MEKKRGLGKGLDLIFAENTEESDGPVNIRIEDIEPNKNQPRQNFEDEALTNLSESISKHGIIQPIVLRPLMSGGYQIIAGERRFRAARMAGLKEVPAIIKDMDDRELMETALIENLQREDLNPIEEAKGLMTLISEHGLTQDEAADSVGKSRPAVANALRLLSLPEEVQKMVSSGRITAGHARCLLPLDDVKVITQFAEKIEKEDLSVREAERLVKMSLKEKNTNKQPVRKLKFYEEVQLALHDSLGRKVSVEGTNSKGVLKIEFYGEEDLKNLLAEIEKK